MKIYCTIKIHLPCSDTKCNVFITLFFYNLLERRCVLVNLQVRNSSSSSEEWNIIHSVRTQKGKRNRVGSLQGVQSCRKSCGHRLIFAFFLMTSNSAKRAKAREAYVRVQRQKSKKKNCPTFTNFKPRYPNKGNQPNICINFQNWNQVLHYELINSVAYLTIWHFDTSQKE